MALWGRHQSDRCLHVRKYLCHLPNWEHTQQASRGLLIDKVASQQLGGRRRAGLAAVLSAGGCQGVWQHHAGGRHMHVTPPNPPALRQWAGGIPAVLDSSGGTTDQLGLGSGDVSEEGWGGHRKDRGSVSTRGQGCGCIQRLGAASSVQSVSQTLLRRESHLYLLGMGGWGTGCVHFTDVKTKV